VHLQIAVPAGKIAQNFVRIDEKNLKTDPRSNIFIQLQNYLFDRGKMGFPEHILPFHGIISLCDRAKIAMRHSNIRKLNI